MQYIIKQSYELTECYPQHEPREKDPHYNMFRSVRERMNRLGLMKCWICNSTDNIELHHSLIEFALQNGVDILKFESEYPEFKIQSDDEFRNFIESEGNLLPLCVLHHRGICGVHSLPYPLWLPQRFWKSNIAPPARKEIRQ